MQPTTSTAIPSYELIDFGSGRKLEAFGGVVVDRPAPSAIGQRADPAAWSSAELIFEPSARGPVREGTWISKRLASPPVPSSPIASSRGIHEPWTVPVQALRLQARLQASGQIGMFPEHWQHWDWFESNLTRWRTGDDAASRGAREPGTASRAAREPGTVRAADVLHLFAYTGATTLALAAMGAHVTHVDAMRSAVEWARFNARASHLDTYPIRWIVDDARRYVLREQRRRRQYDLILLDPPSYGHGTGGQSWSIQRDLGPLLRACRSLLSDTSIGIILTGHSPEIDLEQLHATLLESPQGPDLQGFQAEQAALVDRSGRSLDCGFIARFLTIPFSRPRTKG